MKELSSYYKSKTCDSVTDKYIDIGYFEPLFPSKTKIIVKNKTKKLNCNVSKITLGKTA